MTAPADNPVPGAGPTPLHPTPRTTLHRKKERGTFDRQVVDAILDEGLVCHVGYSDAGTTFVVPTAYARMGDHLYLHGAPANRMLAVVGDGAEACLTVTLLDGLVLARSAFHHSMNYRSVLLLAHGSRVDEEGEKRAAVTAIVEHLVPGRGADAREPTGAELRATRVVRLPIAEGSAKVRAGGPLDEEEDLALPIWAGHLGLRLAPDGVVPDPDLPVGTPVPAYVDRHADRS